MKDFIAIAWWVWFGAGMALVVRFIVMIFFSSSGVGGHAASAGEPQSGLNDNAPWRMLERFGKRMNRLLGKFFRFFSGGGPVEHKRLSQLGVDAELDLPENPFLGAETADSGQRSDICASHTKQSDPAPFDSGRPAMPTVCGDAGE